MSQDPPVPPPPDLCMVGAGVPPVGTISNFENPETLVPVLFSVPVLLAIISVIFTKGTDLKNRLDFAAIALVLSLAHICLLFTQARYARHQWDVRACWYSGTYIKTLFSLEILSTFVLFFSKASILLLFHQLFEIKRPTRIAILYGIIFTALLYIFVNITLSAIFTAPHAGETWAGILMYKDPRKQLIWGIVQSVLGTGLDLFIFLLPIPIILKLHLSTNGKIQLLAVFAIASV
ncbi:hypothetical protein NUW58_g4304 [Xylaria curta]|uniref:Uncharacterized protein n=1 Tax=Xylaria curta TaxID=42375 RepID=A0ACC1P8H9_9PEZI|nr:hypothetical protein NUW58_g4304 [Xylaria curta]